MDEQNKLVVVDHRAGQVVEKRELDRDDNSPGALLRMALERDLPIDKLEKLMELQERYEANEARKAYVLAMSEFKARDCPVIVKDKSVQFKNVCYKHATLANVVEQCVAGLAKHGFHHEWDVDQSTNIRVTCRITHRLGHHEDKSLVAAADNSGTKNAIQAIASTVTYLERYTLLMALGLAPAEDDDGQASAPAQSAPAQDASLPPRAARAVAVWQRYLGSEAQFAMQRFVAADAADWGDDHYAKLQAAWSVVREHETPQDKAAALKHRIDWQ